MKQKLFALLLVLVGIIVGISSVLYFQYLHREKTYFAYITSIENMILTFDELEYISIDQQE